MIQQLRGWNWPLANERLYGGVSCVRVVKSEGIEVTAVSVDLYPIRCCINGDLVVVQDE